MVGDDVCAQSTQRAGQDISSHGLPRGALNTKRRSQGGMMSEEPACRPCRQRKHVVSWPPPLASAVAHGVCVAAKLRVCVEGDLHLINQNLVAFVRGHCVPEHRHRHCARWAHSSTISWPCARVRRHGFGSGFSVEERVDLGSGAVNRLRVCAMQRSDMM
jgi:hypothetical protein